MPVDRPAKEQQEAFADYLVRARAGERAYAWLHRLVLQAGYANVAPETQDGGILVTTAQLSRALHASVRALKNWRHDGLPVAQESRGHYPALYDIVAVMRWLQARQGGAVGDDQDPLLSMPGYRSSPALEAYRREKAREAKRRNDTEEGHLLDAREFNQELALVWRMFRDRSQAIERAHGRAVGDDLRHMLDSTEKAWREAFARRRKDTEGTEVGE